MRTKGIVPPEEDPVNPPTAARFDQSFPQCAAGVGCQHPGSLAVGILPGMDTPSVFWYNPPWRWVAPQLLSHLDRGRNGPGHFFPRRALEKSLTPPAAGDIIRRGRS
jgi:hypothetical protein